ncbi:outer membrane beta-barrel family protein [Persicobacter psychrovividus]|uniref:TonB-dependent receptor n=1 Tax=Persicobacter psychrovividus TaxID=387638 RepID=A0ABM7VC23_9BACT|nr:TonB-dependent receptor [Persicobacter psychrovividus]
MPTYSKLAMLLAVVLFSSFDSYAQISGQILDSEQTPVPFCNILLLSTSDSTMISGGVSDEQGKFTLALKSQDQPLLIYVSAIGYEPYYSPKIIDIQVAQSIVLKKADQLLNEVTVKGKRSPIRLEVDRKIVDASAIEGASVALDLVGHLPGVKMDLEGNIKYRNHLSFMVFIDGEPAEGGVDQLRNIPVEKIQQIELITNPGAEFSASGLAGIINVVQKRSYFEGYSLNASTTWNTLGGKDVGSYFEMEGKKMGWSVSARYGDKVFGNYQLTGNQKSDDGAEIQRDEKYTAGAEYAMVNYDFFYKWKSNNQFTIRGGLTPITSRNTNKMTGENVIVSDNHTPQTTNFDLNNSSQIINGNARLDYYFNDSPANNLKVNFNYFSFLRQSAETLDNEFLSADQRLTAGYSKLVDAEHSITAKLGGTHTLTENMKLNWGGEFDQNSMKGLHLENNVEGGSTALPDQYAPYFDQYVYSVYTSLKGKVGEVSGQLGLRYEITDRKTAVVDQTNGGAESTLYDHHFNNLFPSLHLKRNVGEHHEFGLSYARRIDRPYYFQFLPIQHFVETYLVETGNPSLLPALTDTYTLSYFFYDKWNFSFDAFFNQTVNHTTYVYESMGAGIFNRQLVNTGSANNLGVESSVNVPIFSWWDVSTSVAFYHHQLHLTYLSENQYQRNLNKELNLTNNFSLPLGFSLDMMLDYQGKQVLPQGYTKPYTTMDLRVGKAFGKKEHFRMSISVNNILNSNQVVTIMEDDGFSTFSDVRYEPFATFRLAYNFQKSK